MADKDETQPPGTWIFVCGGESDIPEQWRDRAVPVWLLPLTIEETSTLIEETRLRAQLTRADAEIASLLAAGLSPTAIATRTGKSPRTIHRRLAYLRELLNTTSTAELAILLARRGF